jgi:uncharacterized protein YwgA
MEASEYILAVTGAADTVPGRTMLQKLVYLLARIRGDELAYGAYFYGPYSSSVQESASALAAAGSLEEEVKVLPNWQSDQFDLYQYTYKLTTAGRSLAGALDRDVRDQAQSLVATTRTVGAFSQAPLAIAAKVDHIRRVAPEAELADMPLLAREFGWRISPGDAEKADALLRALHLG